MTEPTAKQRHRAGAFDLARNDEGLVRCILRGTPGHECGGRLQAHHAILGYHVSELPDEIWRSAPRHRNPNAMAPVIERGLKMIAAGQSIHSVSRELDIPRSTLRAWRKRSIESTVSKPLPRDRGLDRRVAA